MSAALAVSRVRQHRYHSQLLSITAYVQTRPEDGGTPEQMKKLLDAVEAAITSKLLAHTRRPEPSRAVCAGVQKADKSMGLRIAAAREAERATIAGLSVANICCVGHIISLSLQR